MASASMRSAAEDVTVGQLMSRDPITVPADLTIEELVELFAASELSRVPVIDSGGRVIGVVGKTDAIRDAQLRGEPAGSRVRDVMVQAPQTLRAKDSIAAAAQRMHVEALHVMPVVSDDGRAIGMLSASDIIAWVAGERPDVRGAGPRAMRIAELMSRPAVTCRRTDTLQTAIEQMRDHDVGAVAVVDDDDRLAGIVTDRGACLTAADLEQPLDEIRVDAAMTGTVLVCHPDDPVRTAEDVMASEAMPRRSR